MARTIAFTGSGALTADGSIGEPIASPGEPDTGSGTTSDEELMGFAFKGFTSVTVYDGTDASGKVVAYGPGPGTFSWNEPIRFDVGVYVGTAGAGSGSLWVA